MTTITTVDGLAAIVDDHFAFLAERTWRTSATPNGKRVVQEVLQDYWHHLNDRPGPFLHRLVTNARRGQRISHINGDGLDCRRANLRVSSGRSRPQPKPEAAG